jgi:putative endonuclease
MLRNRGLASRPGITLSDWYFEVFADIETAIAREKQLKGWRRSKKIKLIELLNPKWDDLTRRTLASDR